MSLPHPRLPVAGVARPRMASSRWQSAAPTLPTGDAVPKSALLLPRFNPELEDNPMRPGPRGHAHAARGGMRAAGFPVHVGPRHVRPHHRRRPYYPAYYGYATPWWGYPYGYWWPSYYGYGYGYEQQAKEVPETCCFDAEKGTLFCPGTEYDGAPAFAKDTTIYEGRKMAYVSSPAFRKDRWIWLCPEERAPNPCRGGRLRRAMNPDTPNSAAAEETGAAPLGVELPAQAGETSTPSPVPHAQPWPGAHCIGHPDLASVVCCSKDGIYGKHDQCIGVPSMPPRQENPRAARARPTPRRLAPARPIPASGSCPEGYLQMYCKRWDYSGKICLEVGSRCMAPRI